MLEHPQTLCLKVNGDTAMDIYDDPIAKALNLTPLSNSLLIAIEEEINLIKKLTTIAPSLNAGKTYEELYGEERARELKLSHSESQKKYVCSEQTKEKLRKANKKQFDDPIKRKIHLDSFLLNNGNHKNTVWVNNGIKSKRVDKTHISSYINNGWVKGRLLKDTQFWKHGNRNKDPKTGRFVKKGE